MLHDETNLTNPTLHLSHIPLCITLNQNFQSGVLWVMGLVHCGICETGLLWGFIFAKDFQHTMSLWWLFVVLYIYWVWDSLFSYDVCIQFCKDYRCTYYDVFISVDLNASVNRFMLSELMSLYITVVEDQVDVFTFSCLFFWRHRWPMMGIGMIWPFLRCSCCS